MYTVNGEQPMSKFVRISEATHSDVADMASILNLSRQEQNATLGDAIRIAVSKWLEQNRVIFEKEKAAQAEAN